MKISKLLRFLLSFYAPGIVGGEGGGAAPQDDPDLDEGGGDQDSADGDKDLLVDGVDEEQDEGKEPEAKEEDGDEVVVLIDEEGAQAEEEDPARAPEWLRALRKSNREKDRRIRELEAKVAASAPAQQAVTLGPKPKAEDFNFDPDQFEAALDAWYERKADVDKQARAQAREQEEQTAKWQKRVDAVSAAAKTLKVSDYEDASANFEDLFSPVQQGIVMGAPDDPKVSVHLRYVLGKNEAKARELAAISDPVKFTRAIALLETRLKVEPRKTAPPPERVVRSAVAGAAAVENQLERLRQDARRTGDYTKVTQYQREQRAKQAKATA